MGALLSHHLRVLPNPEAPRGRGPSPTLCSAPSLLKGWAWGRRVPASPQGLFSLVTSPFLEPSRCPPRVACRHRRHCHPRECQGFKEPVSGPGGRQQHLFFITSQLPLVFSHPSPPYILKLILFLVLTLECLPMLS